VGKDIHRCPGEIAATRFLSPATAMGLPPAAWNINSIVAKIWTLAEESTIQGDDKVIKNGAFPIKLIVENLQTDEIFQQCDLMAVWWHPHGNCKRQRGVLQWQYIVHSKKNPKYSCKKKNLLIFQPTKL